jgi:tRNA(Arg) A34 adenosine deaminase TadA
MADGARGDIVAAKWHGFTMGKMDRRAGVAATGSGIVALVFPRSAAALDVAQRSFIAEAARMRREAVAGGDQPFGAVVVKDGAIVGYGPSRVVLDHNPNAHAERIALSDAQKRLGLNATIGAVIYSTSRQCVACEDALAVANVERMYFGVDGTDAGRPRRSR